MSTAPSSGARILVNHKAAGVALLVTPWNFPAAMATRKIGPALAAGCTVVIKPASATPLTMLALMSILEEAGVPPGVRSEEHTSELQSLMRLSYAVFCLKKQNSTHDTNIITK